eukprot:GHVS01076035.1.p1 GENE.GHVS01076035.1~~GHVS01076035.1.p1  ORF type:complete len:634 (-),score=101.54 GHVS01076035.1:224-2125(-)
MVGKSRVTAVDVRAIVTNLRGGLRGSVGVVGMRVANVYDMSPRVYVLKLTGRDTKLHLLIEAGVRAHITQWQRDKGRVPSGFTMKLRKFLRTRRVEKISQLGCDRVVDIQLGLGDRANHLLLEFYVQGNVILTDCNYVIASVLRPHEEGHTKVAVGEVYSKDEALNVIGYGLNHRTIRSDETKQSFVAIAQQLLDKQKQNKSIKRLCGALSPLVPFAHPGLLLDCVLAEEGAGGEEVDRMHRAAIRAVDILRQLSQAGDVGGPEGPVEAVDYFQLQQQTASLLTTTLSVCTPPDTVPVEGPIYGWMLSKQKVDPEGPIVFDDLVPFLTEQTLKDPALQHVKWCRTFEECVDLYFSGIEVLKEEKEVEQRASATQKKIERIQADQQKRLLGLSAEAGRVRQDAELVEQHIELVTAALQLLQAAVATQADWTHIQAHLKMERKRGHPVAAHVEEVELEKNLMYVLLDETPEEADDFRQDATMRVVCLDMRLSAYGNIERLHSLKKQAKIKLEKTKQQSERVLSEAQRKVDKEVQQRISTLKKTSIQKIRKHFWFEKFYWFVSSDSYLVLAGRDATQNDVLYKRYMQKHDVYVHADTHGAASCIVKNRARGKDIPSTTLLEAGTTCIHRREYLLHV